MNRVSESEGLYHPHAVKTARDMESVGYIQADPKDLKDKEDVMVMLGHTGSTAPARYHRAGLVADADGRRDEHVLELFPDSQYAETLPYDKTLHPQSQEGEPFSRIAIFRLTQPEHAEHGKAMYAARDSMHRAGSNT